MPRMGSSIERISLTVNGTSYALGPLEGLDDLREQILRAARATGGFLNVTADGGQRLSFFVTSATAIVISVSTVALHADTADGTPARCGEDAFSGYEDDDIPFDII
ncbi:MAG: hypothetical protein K0R81_2595 [Microbacterium sp.]|nr:hypothetical protein [Microbacterium sp.]